MCNLQHSADSKCQSEAFEPSRHMLDLQSSHKHKRLKTGMHSLWQLWFEVWFLYGNGCKVKNSFCGAFAKNANAPKDKNT